jgi:hypothetical protein
LTIRKHKLQTNARDGAAEGMAAWIWQAYISTRGRWDGAYLFGPEAMPEAAAPVVSKSGLGVLASEALKPFKGCGGDRRRKTEDGARSVRYEQQRHSPLHVADAVKGYLTLSSESRLHSIFAV